MIVGVLLLATLVLVPNLPSDHPGAASPPTGPSNLGAGSGSLGVPARLSAGMGASHVAAAAHFANNSSAVDPYAYYGVSGPAPYGITDFGVAANGTGYRYTTNSFLGTLNIGAMSASAKVVFKGHTYVIPGDTVQLNVILVLTNGSQSAAYWVQNVPFFNAPNDFIDFEDNIWNMSTNGTLPAGTIVGNGSIDSGSVYIASATNQPGNNLSLGFPANVSVKLSTGTHLGIPYVRFDYEDGFGWQTYDNATFPWAHGGWQDEGFVVDGTQYLPNGLFYDAEWVYGGPGDGLSSDNLQSNFTMGLEYWNGHNYQAVPNAFNFGSDTGESMHNVSESTGLGVGPGGLPTATVTVGNSPHEMLYGRANVSIVNVTSRLPNATLSFGGLSVPFTGTDANVTLAPGTYQVQLWNGTAVVATRNITVTAGEYLALTLTPDITPYAVSFDASGLPTGDDWSVVIGNQTFRSSGASLTVDLVNGTYPYSIVPVPGYFVTQYEGTLHVVGRATTLQVQWMVFVYPVTITAAGLPSDIPWSVTVLSTSGAPGASATGASGTAVVDLANGSYQYSISVQYAYVAILNPDTFVVLAEATSLTVQFAIRDAFLVGSVTPATASLTVGGTALALGPDGSFNESLLPGRYALVASASGYTTYFDNVTLTAGNATALSIGLVHVGSTPGQPANGTPTSASPTSGLDAPIFWILGAFVGIAALGTAWALRSRRRSR